MDYKKSKLSKNGLQKVKISQKWLTKSQNYPKVAFKKSKVAKNGLQKVNISQKDIKMLKI